MTTTTEMQRTWTSVGSDHNGDASKRARLAAMFDRMDWRELEPGTVEAMMPALGIRAAIKELRIPKVSHYAISNELAPYGLYGIRGHFTNGQAEVYICDEGTRLVVLASDFHPNSQGHHTPTTEPPTMQTANPPPDDSRRCLTCGQIHPPCKTLDCNNATHCPTDEPGQPFLHCDSCDAGMVDRDTVRGGAA